MNRNLAHISPITAMHINSAPLLQLLRLCSPALPIGSYAYSQGLESACEQESVDDMNSLHNWICGVMQYSLQFLDIPVYSRLFDAHTSNDVDAIDYWNQYLLSSRETSELYLEDTQMGRALVRLLSDLEISDARPWLEENCSLANAICLACTKWNIEKKLGANGMIWSWCENQVSIGIKLIPLGQTSGQRILSKLIPIISATVESGLALEENQIGASCPGMIMSSMQHEDQYTRLFRS